MHLARPVRVRTGFRSNPLWNQAITHSFAIREKSPICVFNNLHTPAPLNPVLCPVFPGDYALPHKKGGGTPPSNTEVRQSPMPSYKSFIVNRLCKPNRSIPFIFNRLSNIGGEGGRYRVQSRKRKVWSQSATALQNE